MQNNQAYHYKTAFSKGCAERYKFGFNGQNKDDEIYGPGNTYSAQYWEYDARLGRRWNLDPVDQISISNYATFTNNPVMYTDPNGDDPRKRMERFIKKHNITDYTIRFRKDGSVDLRYTTVEDIEGELVQVCCVNIFVNTWFDKVGDFQKGVNENINRYGPIPDESESREFDWIEKYLLWQKKEIDNLFDFLGLNGRFSNVGSGDIEPTENKGNTNKDPLRNESGKTEVNNNEHKQERKKIYVLPGNISKPYSVGDPQIEYWEDEYRIGDTLGKGKRIEGK